MLEVMERLRKHTTVFYSTHILSDVQRVSDTVAILDHGKLISQAPIEELLRSNGKPVFNLVLKGDAAKTQARLAALPWVTAIQSTPVNSHVNYQVTVSDEVAAETQLLRLVLSDEQVTVLEFGRKKVDLEEIFLGLTEGGNHGKH